MDCAVAPRYVNKEDLSSACARVPVSDHLRLASVRGTTLDVPPVGAPAIPPWPIKLQPLHIGENTVTMFEEERALAAAKAAAVAAATAHAAVHSCIATANLPSASEGSTAPSEASTHSAASLQTTLDTPICRDHEEIVMQANNDVENTNLAAESLDWEKHQSAMWRQALENMDQLCNHITQSVAGHQKQGQMGVAVVVATSILATANAWLPSVLMADMGMPVQAGLPPGLPPAQWHSVPCASQHAGPVQDPPHAAKMQLSLAQHVVTGVNSTESSKAGCFSTDQAPQVDAQSNRVEESTDTLKLHLSYLIELDPGRVLVVRKINRLGLQSPTTLANHFARYGTVDRVLVAHSKTKQASFSHHRPPSIKERTRPAGLGFVVMRLPEEACMILAEGSEQLIDGMSISVRQFECHQSLKKNDGEVTENVPQADVCCTGSLSSSNEHVESV